jgi:hemolysin III
MNLHELKLTQIANISASAIGLFLSIPGLIFLMIHSLREGNGLQIASCAVYGGSLVVSYTIFTLYHIFRFNERWGRIFRILDHATIFLLIAATYTPLTLVFLRGHGGRRLLAAVWALTVFGVVFKIFYVDRFNILAPLIYLFMGWLILLDLGPALKFIPSSAMHLLLGGGFLYSIGLIFFYQDRIPFNHAIWHIFVLAGSLCHYLVIFDYVLP